MPSDATSILPKRFHALDGAPVSAWDNEFAARLLFEYANLSWFERGWYDGFTKNAGAHLEPEPEYDEGLQCGREPWRMWSRPLNGDDGAIQCINLLGCATSWSSLDAPRLKEVRHTRCPDCGFGGWPEEWAMLAANVRASWDL